MSGVAGRAAAGTAMLLYPFAVYWGLNAGGHAWLGLGLIGLGTFRLLAAQRRRSARGFEYATAAVLICFGAAALLARSGRLLLFYPCLMSLGAFSMFGLSILFPPTVIERFARLREPHLPPEAARYCRRVNLVWCGFLAANSAVAAWTALQASQRIWLFYNGFLSYVLMGALFSVEFLVRSRLQARHRTN